MIRLDERLIHGQIATAWCKSLCSDTLLVIDNSAAADEFITKTLYMAAPLNMKTFVMNVEDALNVLNDPRCRQRHIFIVMRHINEFLEVIGRIADIKEINIGNYGRMIPSEKPRISYTSNLFLNEDEAAELKRVLAFSIPCYMQMTPSVAKTELGKILDNPQPLK